MRNKKHIKKLCLSVVLSVFTAIICAGQSLATKGTGHTSDEESAYNYVKYIQKKILLTTRYLMLPVRKAQIL